MSAYVSRAALKAAVDIDDSVDDAVIDATIIRASAAVDGYLERYRTGYVGFGSVSSNARESVGSNTRVYDGTGDDTLFIDDAVTVASVSVDGTAVSSNNYRLWPYNDSPKRAIIYAQPSVTVYGTVTQWSNGTANVGVNAFWATSLSVPEDVEQTSLAIAIVYWRRYQQGEPAPVVTPDGARGYVTTDPEVEGLLHAGLAGWISPGVWGA